MTNTNAQPDHPMLAHLRDGTFLARAHGADRPTDADLDACEAEIGLPLPPAYRAFQKNFGAVYVEVKEAIWPRPKPLEIGPAWTFNYAFIVFGLGAGVPDWMSLRDVFTDFHGAIRDSGRDASRYEKLIPFFRRQIGSRDYACLDPSGALFMAWSNADPEPLALDFDAFLAEEAAYLSAKMDEMIERRIEAEPALAPTLARYRKKA